MSEIFIETYEASHNVLNLCIQLRIGGDMGDTTRQFLLNGADDELDGAVKRAIWRTWNDAMTGKVDSIHHQRAVVRDEVVPYALAPLRHAFRRRVAWRLLPRPD